MPHQRQLIRQAAVAALLDNTSAQSRVSATRVTPFKKGSPPVLAVYTLTEEVDVEESLSRAPRELQRTLNLVVEGWVSPEPGNPVDDAVDALALEVEAAMDADPYLSSTAADSCLESTEVEVLQDGERLVGHVTLTYAVQYQTKIPAEAPELDDFVTAGTTYQVQGGVAGDDGTQPAEDVFTVQEVES